MVHPISPPTPPRAGILLALLLASTAASAAEPAAPETVHGGYRIVAHHCPHVCALSDAEAAAWIGVAAGFSPIYAYLNEASCSAPTYQFATRDATEFSADFGFPPSALGLGPDPVTTVAVRCDGQDWRAPGGALLLAAGRMFAYWDGVFFELGPDDAPPPP